MTNSVTHAGLTAAQPIDLNIQVLPGCLRIEVTDEGAAGFDPVATPPYPGQNSGRGLWMVDQLTDRWGVDFTHSTRVWSEFDLDPHRNTTQHVGPDPRSTSGLSDRPQ